MKKFLAVLLLTLASVPAMAQHYGHHGHHGHWVRGYGGGWNWVPALIIGGIAGAAIANNRQTETVIVQPPVVVQNPPVYVQRQTVCSEWKEIQNSDGVIYRERTCSQ